MTGAIGRSLVAGIMLAACGSPSSSSPSIPSTATAPWRLPAGWRHETFTFPLEFAPSLAHRGIEELRFPPGFLDVGAPNRWSYAFTWRLDDPGVLDAAQLSAELTTYFRDLLVSVDGDKKRITSPDAIVVRATPDADRFALSAHVIDAFGDAAPLDLTGTAHRTSCGTGALWVFVLAPETSPIRSELRALAAEATCGQPQLPTKK